MVDDNNSGKPKRPADQRLTIEKVGDRRAQRRRLLKGITAAGAAGAPVIVGKQAGGWIKPVIESVTIPAHAQTSESIVLNANVKIGEDTENPCAHDLGGCGPGFHVVAYSYTWLWDDSSGITFTAMVSPPQAVEVSLSFTQEAPQPSPASLAGLRGPSLPTRIPGLPSSGSSRR